MIENKKGSAIVELVISLVLFATIILIVTNFKTYLTTQKADMVSESAFYVNVDNIVADLYAEDDWANLDDFVIEDPNIGDIRVYLVPSSEPTKYNTNILNVSIKTKKNEKNISLERSVYYNGKD